jgi:hypothetical protein
MPHPLDCSLVGRSLQRWGQNSQVGWFGVKNVKLFLREPLVPNCPNHIMFAQHYGHGLMEVIERSDTPAVALGSTSDPRQGSSKEGL